MSHFKICADCGNRVAIHVTQCRNCNGTKFRTPEPSEINRSNELNETSARNDDDKKSSVNRPFKRRTETASPKHVSIISIDSFPGHEITRVLGMVIGHSSSSFGIAERRVIVARNKALQDLIEDAQALGADAVVGVTITISAARGFFGWISLGQSVIVQVTGTAVLVKPIGN